MSNIPVELILFPPPEPIEFRLYYDVTGKVVCYTCEKLEGAYIVIDAETYASARPDIRIVDGKISRVSINARASMLKPGPIGIKCAKEDVSIVVDETYTGDTVQWKVETYEL